ncbi:hypothetical protein GCM10020369_02440 [Cryptosporangium minutisporangium]|uniref:Uncharacterized protein n=1 Tax=Cryptosporangium minutisporangium TaxID=113569 RepID=A0ABP6SPD0_9ACTN
MRTLGVVEAKRTGERVEDDVGHGTGAALFELDVVVDADARQQSEFLATQAGDAAAPDARRQPDVRRTQPGATGAKVGTEFGTTVHGGIVPQPFGE